MSSIPKDIVGRIVSVPLIRGGFAFGYVTFNDNATMILCDVFDRISDKSDIPEGIEHTPLVLRDYMVGGVEFTDTSRKKVKLPDWKLSDRRMPNSVTPKNRFFIIGSPRRYQIVDIYDKSYKRIATEEEFRKYPRKSYPFPPMTTKVLEKYVRHLDIDPKDI